MESTPPFEAFNLKPHFKSTLLGMGLTVATTIQARCYSPVLSGRDVMGIAQTGTGKTLAYLLPSYQLWRYTPRHDPQLLVLVPTRELSVQVEGVARELAGSSGIRCVGVFGGAGMQPQAARLREGADVVVGTPGRLLDLALNGHLRLSGVRRLVLDEVDEMLQQGFRTQIGRVLDLLPRRRQNLMFSATMSDEVSALADVYFHTPLRVEAAPAGTPVECVEQVRYEARNFATKVRLLLHLLRADASMRRVMVFVATKALCDRLHEALSEALSEAPVEGVAIDYMHSGRTQSQRFRVLEAFRGGQLQVLVATDLISRGIDVAGVSHVVSFDVPDEAGQYVHRVGRTGRMSAAGCEERGLALAFVGDREGPSWEAVEALMGRHVPALGLPDGVDGAPEQDWERPQPHMRNQLDQIAARPGGAYTPPRERPHNNNTRRRATKKGKR